LRESTALYLNGGTVEDRIAAEKNRGRHLSHTGSIERSNEGQSKRVREGEKGVGLRGGRSVSYRGRDWGGVVEHFLVMGKVHSRAVASTARGYGEGGTQTSIDRDVSYVP